MDTQKDKSGGKLAHFFEVDTPHVNPFASGALGYRAYARAERIVGGIFLATNHLEHEPLKNAVRTSATTMLKQVLSLRSEMRSPISFSHAAFLSAARYTVSLLRMLGVTGSLSPQNLELLIGAIDGLSEFIDTARQSPLSESLTFSKDDFYGSEPIKDIRDRSTVKDIKDTSGMQIRRESGSSTVRKNNILGILRSGEDFGVPDISTHLPEYSKKTIQRDLTELMNEGRVKRAGLKRWSRYSLVR